MAKESWRTIELKWQMPYWASMALVLLGGFFIVYRPLGGGWTLYVVALLVVSAFAVWTRWRYRVDVLERSETTVVFRVSIRQTGRGIVPVAVAGSAAFPVQPHSGEEEGVSEGMPEAPVTTVVPGLKPDADRKAALAQAVANSVRQGWSVQSQTDFQAVMVKGKRTSHGLHLFLSIITLGFWLIVWAVVWYLNRDQNLVINVDPYGNVNIEK